MTNLPATTATTPADYAAGVHSALQQISALLVALDDQRAALAAQGDHQALLGGLVFMRHLRSQLSVLERSTEDDAARLVDALPREGRARRYDVPGVGLVELRNQYPSRKWHDHALVPALVRAALDPHGTGELPATFSVMDVAHTVAKALTDCARMEWRTGTTGTSTGVATYGLDPNDFRDEAGEPRTTVAITTTAAPKD
jgi:hypothetical protein